MQSSIFLIVVGALTLSSCSPSSPSVEGQRARVADGARVELRDSKGKSVGVLTVAMYSGGGVQFTGHLTDLPPGPHAVHIHENGKCDPPDFASSGSHLNLSGKQHPSHDGDIGNIPVKLNGMADITFVAKSATILDGPNSLLKPGGTSLILHEKADDMQSDPSGNSGARIACGIITR